MKIRYQFFFPAFRRMKAPNLTSGWVKYRSRREPGDSRAVTSIQEPLVSRFFYSSVVSFEKQRLANLPSASITQKCALRVLPYVFQQNLNHNIHNLNFRNCLSCVYNCDDLSFIYYLFRSSNI